MLDSKAQTSAKQLLKKTEQISVSVLVSGDFKAKFDFSGPLGTQLPGESSEGKAACELSSLFRKIKYRNQPVIEAWLTLECINKGQKNTYKPHRIYLDPTKSKQKVKLPMLDFNLKNVQLEFEEMSVKIGK